MDTLKTCRVRWRESRVWLKLRSAALAAGLILAVVTAASQQPATPAVSAASVSAPTSARKLAYELDVTGSKQWTDTGIELVAGDRLALTASGSMHNSTSQTTGPEGFPRGWRDLLRALPVNGAGVAALIARLGDSPAAVPFLVGASKELTVNIGGHLFLGINQPADQSSDGSFHMSVKIVPAEKPVTVALAKLAVPASLLAQISRRVADAQGDPGDLVNFVVIGSEGKLKAAFEAAGWVQVDRNKKDAVLHALLSSTEKESYIEMPMSQLYLFGRAQDFGFARADPVEVVESRHHLRVWKAPFDYEGQAVWAGAATHDVGFERDQRSGHVTHKIDPKVDQERDFVESCFQQAGVLTGTAYLTPSDAVHSAETATGGAIQSDGRVLVMTLRP